MLAFGLSFGTVTAVAGVHHGIFTAMGCYVDAYGTRDPYPRRGPLLAGLSAAFVVAFVAGSLAAGDRWAMVGVLTVVAVAATLFVRTLRLSGPGSYFVILVAAMGAFLPPAGLADTAVRAGCLAIGAAVSWVAGMSGWPAGPYGPEERAVSAAFRSVAAFADARTGTGAGAGAGAGPGAGGPSPPGDLAAAGRSAYVAVHGAWAALDDARGGRREAPAPRRMLLYALMARLEVLLDAVQNAVERGGTPLPAERTAWLRAAATDIAAGRVPGPCPADSDTRATPEANTRTNTGTAAETDTGAGTPTDTRTDTGAAGPSGRDTPRELLEAARELWPVPLPPRKSVAAELRRVLSRSSPALPVALRVGLAVAVGTVLGTVLPLLHPAWVAVGAAAALQGGPGQQPARRAQARLVGTVAGVAVAALVFHSYQPGTWVTVVVATVAHAVSRGVPPGALLVRTLLNTPVALLLVDAATSTGLGTLAAFRLLDLTLGLILGVAAALLVRGVPRRRVCAAVANAVAATGAAVQERLRTGTVRSASEGASWQRMAELWDMHAAVPAEEIRTTGTADRLWPAVLAVRRLLAWTVLGGPVPPAPDDGARAGSYMDALAHAARAGLPGSLALRSALPGPPRAPEPAHDPELRRRLATLGSALVRPAPTAPADDGTGGG
ncbi:FUSC family protein [Streptomyces sp. DH41]|uniref:FUSC family protein n=1 Tax=Streptomyces sp. DH41 TaxID=3040125 RepID=UPI0024435EDD|nr:FUSC family protein [Streptomyces sp. DH41]MDG9724821.1 FUSC family protein [Streptomyces sp. DH41]